MNSSSVPSLWLRIYRSTFQYSFRASQKDIYKTSCTSWYYLQTTFKSNSLSGKSISKRSLIHLWKHKSIIFRAVSGYMWTLPWVSNLHVTPFTSNERKQIGTWKSRRTLPLSPFHTSYMVRLGRIRYCDCVLAISLIFSTKRSTRVVRYRHIRDRV